MHVARNAAAAAPIDRSIDPGNAPACLIGLARSRNESVSWLQFIPRIQSIEDLVLSCPASHRVCGGNASPLSLTDFSNGRMKSQNRTQIGRTAPRFIPQFRARLEHQDIDQGAWWGVDSGPLWLLWEHRLRVVNRLPLTTPIGYSAQTTDRPMTQAPGQDEDAACPCPSIQRPTEEGPAAGSGEVAGASYTCRRCRTALFTEGHLESHAAGAQAITRRKKVCGVWVDRSNQLIHRTDRSD